MRTVGLLVLVLTLAGSAVWLSGCDKEEVVLEMKEDSFEVSGVITPDYLRCEYMVNPLG